MNPGKRFSHVTLLFFLISAAFVSCVSENDGVRGQSAADGTNTTLQSVDPAVLDSIHAEILAGEYGLIDRFIVLQSGEVLADHKYDQDYETIALQYDTANQQYNYDHPEWHPYYKQTDLHTLQSVTKSVTSALLGIALNENTQYDIHTQVIPLFGDYAYDKDDKRLADIEIEDLLTMRSGLEWDEEDYDEATNDCIILEASDDWIQYVLSRPTDTVPGVVFEYNSGASVLLGKIVRIITGQRIDDYAEERLFGPLGIKEYYWKETPGGEMDTEGGLYLSSESLVKIGQLFMNNGRWNDDQIVPEDWVSASTSPVVGDVNPQNDSSIGYGYQWWVPEHTDGKTEIFAGNGYGGQFLMVVPRHELIVVFNGWNIHDRPQKSTWRVLQDRILPTLK